MEKYFISPEQLRSLSFKLASQIQTPPDFLVALWRGGAPIGMYVHEFLKKKFQDAKIDHIAIRTSRYTGIGEAKEEVHVDNLGYIFNHITPGKSVLIVDDVWDAGTTMNTILSKLCVLKAEVKVAVVFYKPKSNKFNRGPDFCVEETNQWLVFPHELEGLSTEEIANYYGKEVVELLK